MGQNQPTIRIPFTQFPGLDQDSARRIWRDFEEVVRNITPTPSAFDAIIDPSLSASVPGNHQYKNFADLVASETWASTRVFDIGVKATTNTAITEPARAHTVAPGPFSMTAFGNTASAFFGPGARQQWDFNGGDVTGVTVTTLRGLELTNTNTTFAANGIVGTLYMENCRVTSAFPGSAGLPSPCSGVCMAVNTNFAATVFANSFYAFDCHYYWASNASLTISPPGAIFMWSGGTWTMAGIGQMTFNNLQVYFRATVQMRLEESISGAVVPVVVSANCTVTEFDLSGTDANGGISLSVNMTSGSCWIHGNAYSALTVSGAALDTLDVNVRSTRAVYDITGPATVDISGIPQGAGSANNLTLRGKGVRANIEMQKVSINAGRTLLQLIGLTDSGITMTASDNFTASGQCYSFDAASARNILILSGLNNSQFAQVSTDAGTLNRVITENADTFLSSAAAVSPSLLNGEIAAVASGIVTLPAPVAATTDLTLHDFRQVFMLMGG